MFTMLTQMCMCHCSRFSRYFTCTFCASAILTQMCKHVTDLDASHATLQSEASLFRFCPAEAAIDFGAALRSFAPGFRVRGFCKHGTTIRNAWSSTVMVTSFVVATMFTSFRSLSSATSQYGAMNAGPHVFSTKPRSRAPSRSPSNSPPTWRSARSSCGRPRRAERRPGAAAKKSLPRRPRQAVS